MVYIEVVSLEGSDWHHYGLGFVDCSLKGLVIDIYSAGSADRKVFEKNAGLTEVAIVTDSTEKHQFLQI